MQNLASVNDIKNLDILVPPLNEQKRIVEKIGELFDKIDEGERSLQLVAPYGDKALGLVEALRQSILKQAFSGKLVKQDPNEGSVSALFGSMDTKKSGCKSPKKGKTI